jgi:hypothetical protein
VSHFDSAAGKMMIGRMFGDSDVSVPAGTGSGAAQQSRCNEQAVCQGPKPHVVLVVINS